MNFQPLCELPESPQLCPPAPSSVSPTRGTARGDGARPLVVIKRIGNEKLLSNEKKTCYTSFYSFLKVIEIP